MLKAADEIEVSRKNLNNPVGQEDIS